MTESPLRPLVHPFVECPNCRQLVEFGAAQCSRCREPIDPNYAAVSAVIVHHNTQACAVANTISGFDAFIPLALIGSILIFVLDLYVSGRPIISLFLLAWPLIPLLIIIGWFFRFGWLKIGDDEFLKARRELRNSFLFWLVVLVVQMLAFAVWRLRAGAT
ncbi:MAG TPA: hypothetical protein VLL54_15990 [Pyrinomonadaceae bacterium]|nr:hypothetical protein [Pyrinomonadaceae bacterium]